jgi:hypothetical protein
MPQPASATRLRERHRAPQGRPQATPQTKTPPKADAGYEGKFGSLLKLKLHATITGVGFWDLKHGNPQLGRTPNDLELHPVLKLTQATCA